MDHAKNKSYKQYEYISRYTRFPYYYQDLDDKYFYGITSNLNKNINYTVHKVRDYDTLDFLSLSYYGRPDLYWVLADFNNIKDPFIENLKEKYDSIRIPTLTQIYYGG